MEPFLTCLTRNSVKLLKNLNPDDVLDYLIQDEIISVGDKDKITAKETQRSQTEALIEMLPSCGNHAFDRFLDALINTEQNPLADVLIATYREFKKDNIETPSNSALTGIVILLM